MENTGLPKRVDCAAAAERIGLARRILITTHARADGDAIGSAAGLRRVLAHRGQQVAAFVHEPVPQRYAFLPEAGGLRVWEAGKAAEALAKVDLLVIVDTCTAAQLGEVAEELSRADVYKLAIDHHLTYGPVADALLLDENAGACAQIITQLCDQAGWPIDAEVAALLYTGLATDTGWFRFSNADSAAFSTAARLVDAGARPNELYERLYLNEPEPRVRLIGEVLSNFELLADGRLAVIRLTRDMISRCGATQQMTEEIINEPQRIGSVVACLLLVEPDGEGPIRASFRSKRDVDVEAIARQFGGGGHARAAGARIPGTLDAVYEQVVPILAQALETMDCNPG